MEDFGKPLPQPVADHRVRCACEWFVQAAHRLLKDSLLGVLSDDQVLNAFKGGALFTGIRGMSVERWGFWKRRLIEMRKDDQNETLCASIDEALEAMTAVEKTAADAIS